MSRAAHVASSPRKLDFTTVKECDSTEYSKVFLAKTNYKKFAATARNKKLKIRAETMDNHLRLRADSD